jgi:hypothetical protein
MFIAHASLPADQPERAARVLADIMQGEAMPFPPGGPHTWMAWAGDGSRQAGWPAEQHDRGGFFSVVEVWVEGAFLIEFLDPQQAASYRRSMTPAHWKAVFGTATAR